MRVVESKAWAKINLAFDVVGLRPDGYHDIETVMHRVELADEIRVERLEAGAVSEYEIRVDVFPQVAPAGTENIAYRAAMAFFEAAGERGAVSIGIGKKIPVAAGLGGGSADAAAVLASMNRLWDVPLAEDELYHVARSVGADVPFCLMCHGDPPRAWAAMACGIGDDLTPLPPLPGVAVVLAKPSVSLLAGEMYGMWDARRARAMGGRGNARARALANWMRSQGGSALKGDAVSGSPVAQVVHLIGNELEPVAAERCPEVLEVKAALLELGAMAAVMSGSGPTVFGLFESDDSAHSAARSLRKRAFSFSGRGPLDVIVTHAGPRIPPGS